MMTNVSVSGLTDIRPSSVILVAVSSCDITVSVVGGISNVVIGLTILKTKSLKTSMNLCLFGLALADLFGAVISLPHRILLYNGLFYPQHIDAVCHLDVFFMTVFDFVQPTMILATSAERYKAIARPLESKGHEARTVLVLLVSWFLCVSGGIVVAFYMKNVATAYTCSRYTGSSQFKVLNFQEVITKLPHGIICILLITTCYYLMLTTLSKHNKEMKRGNRLFKNRVNPVTTKGSIKRDNDKDKRDTLSKTRQRATQKSVLTAKQQQQQTDQFSETKRAIDAVSVNTMKDVASEGLSKCLNHLNADASTDDESRVREVSCVRSRNMISIQRKRENASLWSEIARMTLSLVGNTAARPFNENEIGPPSTSYKNKEQELQPSENCIDSTTVQFVTCKDAPLKCGEALSDPTANNKPENATGKLRINLTGNETISKISIDDVCVSNKQTSAFHILADRKIEETTETDLEDSNEQMTGLNKLGAQSLQCERNPQLLEPIRKKIYVDIYKRGKIKQNVDLKQIDNAKVSCEKGIESPMCSDNCVNATARKNLQANDSCILPTAATSHDDYATVKGDIINTTIQTEEHSKNTKTKILIQTKFLDTSETCPNEQTDATTPFKGIDNTYIKDGTVAQNLDRKKSAEAFDNKMEVPTLDTIPTEKTVDVVEIDGTVHKGVSTDEKVYGAVCVMNPSNKLAGRRKVEMRAAKRIAVLIGLFVLLWIPLPLTSLVLVMKTSLTLTDVEVLMVTHAVGSMTIALNPILGVMLNKQMRTATKNMILKLRQNLKRLVL